MIFIVFGAVLAGAQQADPSISPSSAPLVTPAPSIVPANKPLVMGGEAADWKDLDLTEARVHPAGPNALYVRQVALKGKFFSFLAKQDAEGNWKIGEIFDEASNAFPVAAFFDIATLTVSSDGDLVIDGIMLDGKAVKKTARILADGSLSFVPGFESGSFVGSSLERSKLLGRPHYDETITGLERLNSESLARIGSLETDNNKLLATAESSQKELALAKKSEADAVAERDAALASQTTLLGENTALKAQKDELSASITELKSRNTALAKETDSLKTEITALKVSSDGVEPKSGADTALTPADAGDVAGMQKQIETLDAKVKTLEGRVSTLEASGGSGNDSDVKATVARLQAENEKLMAERATIENNVRSLFLKSGYIASLRPMFTKKILSGFEGGKSEMGSWLVKNGVLQQENKREFFSRYTLPLVQKGTTLLYSFSLKSTGKDWVGAGLHLYATDSPKRGYGHGNSLLVWFTRDPDYYGNKHTYLQLYKSDDDVAMGRVLDAAIEEGIDTELKVEILYQPQDEYITMTVNGVEKVRYKTWFGVDEGVEVAFRTLDSAEFKNLEVFAQP